MSKDKRICIAQIVGVHGVKGLVKIKCFADNPALMTEYGLLTDASGKETYNIIRAAPHKNVFLSEVEGSSDRDEADKLRGTKLYISRDILPKPDEDEFYVEDLVNMDAILEDGAVLGKVVAVQNYGAGDLIEIHPPKRQSILLPFTMESVPNIDIKSKKITVIIPPGLLDEEKNNEQI